MWTSVESTMRMMLMMDAGQSVMVMSVVQFERQQAHSAVSLMECVGHSSEKSNSMIRRLNDCHLVNDNKHCLNIQIENRFI